MPRSFSSPWSGLSETQGRGPEGAGEGEALAAVGDAEAEAVGGDAGGLHVDGDGAGLVEAGEQLVVAQLPVAVGGGGDGAGTHPGLHVLAGEAGDVHDRL